MMLQRLRWYLAYSRLPAPRTTRELTLDEERIRGDLEASPIEVREYAIDVAEYRRWMEQARYEEHHPGYYWRNFHEKSLEHYAAARLLELQPGQVYIDIASQYGAAGEVYGRLYGAEVYLQDLDYPAGFHGRRIGGDAGAMPVPDEFADAMALHCSFEHFEGDSDSRFIAEAGRVLKPGGRCVILPLYLCHRHSCLTDPLLSVPGRVAFDPGALIHASRTWHNRHGRFYDVPHLVERVWNHRGPLRMTVLTVPNYREVHPTCYLRYVAVLEKPGA